MFDEHQIIEVLDEKLKQNDLEKASQILLEYYSTKEPGNDLIFDYLNKMISRGYAKTIASVISISDSKSPLPQLLPLLAEAENKSGNKMKALKIYEQLIELLPSNFEYYYFAAVLSDELNLFDKAEYYFAQVLKIKDSFPPAIFGLGKIFRKQNRLHDSLNYFEKYKSLEPNDANGFYNAGVIYEKLLNYSESEVNYRKAIELKPNFPEARWNLSLLLLREEKYNDGWKEFEWRKKLSFFKKPNFPINEWSNENIEGKSILLYTEQGFGDSIQFLRFASFIKNKVKRLDAFVPIQLKRLFESAKIFNEVYSLKENVNPANYSFKMPLLSLPFLIDADKSKITLSSTLFPIVKKEQSTKPNKNIGIVWKGNPAHENSAARDVPLSMILGLFSSRKDCQLYSFQMEQLTDEEQSLLQKFSVIKLSSEINDFFDTAKLLGEMDILITVDTAIAHLSGSIGVQALLLIPRNSDWRWGNGNRTIWYNSIKLFRQDNSGSWTNALQQLSNELNNGNREQLEAAAALEYKNQQYDSALYLFKKIASIYPDERSFNNLGLTYQLTNNFEEAERCYSKAIKFNPNHSLSYINLANLLINKSDFDSAIKVLLSGLDICSDKFELYYNLALAYHKMNEHDTALEYYRKAYSINVTPNLVLDYTTLLITMNRNKLAEEILIKHSELLNTNERYYLLLGNIYKTAENYTEANSNYQKAISINHNYFEAYLNLASSFFLQRKISESERIYVSMLSHWPDKAEIYYNLGIIKQEQRKLNESVKYLNNALLINNNSEYAYAKSEILLSRKDFIHGLPLYERRLEFLTTNVKPKLPNSWDEMLGKRILIFEEQGIGDTFQFIRFVKLLRKDSAYLQFAVREKLIDFVLYQQIVDDVVNLTNTSTDGFDYIIPIVSLFYLWYTKFHTLPNSGKYLKHFKTNLPTKPNKIKVAIAWRGNPNPIYHRKRHMKLEQLIPLFKEKNVDYYILQNELTKDEMAIVNHYNNLFFIPELVNSWTELSGLVESCDLIVTVDTVYAHLAGAMGKKVITMLSYSADWRWGEDDSESYWYNNMKLIRQKELDDWSNVIDEVLMNINSLNYGNQYNEY